MLNKNNSNGDLSWVSTKMSDKSNIQWNQIYIRLYWIPSMTFPSESVLHALMTVLFTE